MDQYQGPNSQMAPVMTFKDWLITCLIMMIPLVNIILLFIWAFGSDAGTNPNKRNFAKAYLVIVGIGLVIYVVFLVLFFALMAGSAAFQY